MSSTRKKRWMGRVYLGRTAEGKQRFHWVGRFDTRRERDEAVAEARVSLKGRGVRAGLPKCDEYVDRYLAEYERRNRYSSHLSQTGRLSRFREDFAGRTLDIPRAELKDWIHGEGMWSHREPVNPGYLPAITALYNYAINEDDLPLVRNPARRLARRSKGRAAEPPPTEQEFQRLQDACSVLGTYGHVMRALLRFAAFSLMRPSELFALMWADIDFEAMRICKARRVYKGALDEPKTGPRTIALTPPARDAIIGLPRDRDLVFASKTGRRLSQPMMSGYWSQVLVAAGLRFPFYMATKHYGVHYMWTKLGMSSRAIAAQAGWMVSTAEKMLEIYGHGDVGALAEIDRAFEGHRGPPRLRLVEGGARNDMSY